MEDQKKIKSLVPLFTIFPSYLPFLPPTHKSQLFLIDIFYLQLYIFGGISLTFAGANELNIMLISLMSLPQGFSKIIRFE